jgi:hypothetical protein
LLGILKIEKTHRSQHQEEPKSRETVGCNNSKPIAVQSSHRRRGGCACLLTDRKGVVDGEHSRELSSKLFIAHCRGAQMGNWQGARPAYGLRRLLLDENGVRKATLENGQHRSRRATDRIILTPGPLSEIEIIRAIFTSFVERRRSPTEIATELNAKGICNAVGNPWQAQTVNHILRNERYIGHYVYNRTSFKLQRKLVRNPVDMWVRCDDAFVPIISRSLFDRAQKRLAELSITVAVSL